MVTETKYNSITRKNQCISWGLDPDMISSFYRMAYMFSEVGKQNVISKTDSEAINSLCEKIKELYNIKDILE
jgi:hypothetical protein